VDTFISNRQDYCRAYNEAFADLDELITFDTDWKGVAPYIYVVRVKDGSRRDAFMAHLKEQGIGTGIHFLGAHEFSFYADSRRGDLSVTEEVVTQVVTLPLHPFMSDETIDRVVSGVRSFFTAS
jgi:dTDP-4-amino-4,6-dideoxygalactose transaminase